MIAAANVQVAQARQKRLYDAHTKEVRYQVGDLVYLSPPPSVIDSGPKLARRKRATYRITEQHNETTFKIEPCPGTAAEGFKSEVVHANRLTLAVSRTTV